MLSPAPSAANSVVIDALIIGGGLQGLLILDRLSAAGLSCALVTRSDLGVGQTLHSHGVLNAGFGMAGPEPVQLLQQVALPELARRGVSCYGEWVAILPPGVVDDGEIASPPGLDLHGGSLRPLPEVNVDKRALLEALARGWEERIVCGSVSAVQRSANGEVAAVEVARETTPSSVAFSPATVVIAAGAGSKALLRRLGADEGQLAMIKHRPVHVLGVRGPADVLPALDIVSLPDMFFVASHLTSGERTYYATPMQFDARPVDDVPDDARTEVDEGIVDRGWGLLFRLYPPLRSLPGLRFASYAGFRQDIGDSPGVPWCDRISSVPNLVAALPSGLLGAWPVAARALALAKEIVPASRPQPPIPAGGVGVQVGRNHEDGGGITWSSDPPGDRLPRYTSARAVGWP